jgi:hypothetical protein
MSTLVCSLGKIKKKERGFFYPFEGEDGKADSRFSFRGCDA